MSAPENVMDETLRQIAADLLERLMREIAEGRDGR